MQGLFQNQQRQRLKHIDFHTRVLDGAEFPCFFDVSWILQSDAALDFSPHSDLVQCSDVLSFLSHQLPNLESDFYEPRTMMVI